MLQIEEEDRPTVRSSLARQGGYSGLSILHRLHKLYGFNIILDTVFDMMHNIPLNVVSKPLNCYLNEETFDKSAFKHLTSQLLMKDLKECPGLVN